MLKKILDYTANNNMIEKGDRIAVGVSGGADSVCLLYVLQKLYSYNGITLAVVHINHGIRGEEADRDEQFVKELCEKYGLEFYPYIFDVKKLAKEEGLSEEEAGRKVRYQTFLEVCRLHKCNKIAVAHNKNDNAETVLFNLFRGTGIKGLSGIEPSRKLSTEFAEVTLIRPLLCVERKEIEEFLKKENISFQIDSTNLTEDYSRNKIRNKVLAYAACEINAGTVGNINETANKLKEAWEYINSHILLRYQELVRQESGTYSLTVVDLLKEPSIIQKGILRKILENLTGNLKDVEAKHITSILSLCNKQVGKHVHLPYETIAERDYEEIKIYRYRIADNGKSEDETMETIRLVIPGRTIVTQKQKIIETKLLKLEKNESIPKSSCMKWFDYDKIENAVEIRTRREGDYIQINASGGRKKLKDYFIDHKIPQKARDNQILITDGNHVMWIPGEGDRMSEKYKVEESTTNVLQMNMIDLEEIEDDR